MTAKYPSLYAALTPATVNGRRGSTVQCTATLRPIGFVWWENTHGTTVVWHWRTGAHYGERSTERAAVQALRDVSNAASAHALPFGPDDEQPAQQTPPRRAERSTTTSSTRSTPAPPAPAPRLPLVSQTIVWGDSAPAFDLTDAVRRGLKKDQR